jgi:hypothetical protein
MNDSVFTDSASWALILGVISPLFLSIIQQPGWSRTIRSIVTLFASIIIGIVTVLANGGMDDVSGVLGIIALVLVAANTAYRNFWEPTGITPAVESATSGGKRRGGGHRGGATGLPS